MVKNLYAVWVRLDETLPWIELKGTYGTKRKAKQVAKEILNHAKIKIVEMSKRKK